MRTCSRCGKIIEVSNFSLYDPKWFKFNVGKVWGIREGGYGEIYSMNLCESCSKLILDILAEEGYNINKLEYDI